MFAVGDTEVNTFGELFQPYAGFLPSEYRREFCSGQRQLNEDYCVLS